MSVSATCVYLCEGGLYQQLEWDSGETEDSVLIPG